MTFDAAQDNSSINDLKAFNLNDSTQKTDRESTDSIFSAEAFQLSVINKSKGNLELAQGIAPAPEQSEINDARKDILEDEKAKAKAMLKAGKGNTWDYGNTIYSIATLEISTGDMNSGMENMKASIEILKHAKDAPKDDASQSSLTEMMNSYAELLTRPRPGQIKTDVLNERQEAEKVYAETIERASNEKREPYEIADLWRNRGNNLVYLAANSNDVHNAGGKAAYRQQMQTAIDSLAQGLSLVENQKNIQYLPSQALLYGSLGCAEMSRADAAGDKDAVNAEKHLAAAIGKWHQYKNNISRLVIDVTERPQAIKAANSMLTSNLESYLRLLGSEGKQNTPEAQQALQEYKSLTRK